MAAAGRLAAGVLAERLTTEGLWKLERVDDEGTAGTTKVEEAFLAVFLTAFFADFLTAFLAGAFFTDRLATLFFAAFLAEVFFAAFLLSS